MGGDEYGFMMRGSAHQRLHSASRRMFIALSRSSAVSQTNGAVGSALHTSAAYIPLSVT